ncbi:MAG: polyprenyl synthetase family protein [Dehalococcoidia bacterium]|nr:polyprenyl synthetase family protein [Dehalococcoidia bacterium]
MKKPQVFDRYRQAIDAELRSILDGYDLPLYNMLRYHLGWVDEKGQAMQASTGKGLRPTLCLMACEANGANYEKALPAAAAIELLHNFSLIEDDIQDGDRERRHRPTVWSIWGKAQAINAATAMHVLANLAVYRLGRYGVPIQKQERAGTILHVSCLRMIEGQYLDLSFEKRSMISLEEYLDMISLKTARLIACALELGALLGTDDESCIQAFRDYGVNLGLAFQIRDDMLGIWGDENQTGKPAAGDIRRKKKSFPIVFAYNHSNGKAREELFSIYRRTEVNQADVDRVLKILEETGVQEQAQQAAGVYRDRALANIEAMGLSPAADLGLRELTCFLVDRDS